MIESNSEAYSEETNPSEHLRKLNAEIAIEKILLDQLRTEISRVVIGQKDMIDSLLIALLTEGHVLLEGLPGLAKTLAVKSLAQTMNLVRLSFVTKNSVRDVVYTLCSTVFEKVDR